MLPPPFFLFIFFLYPLPPTSGSIQYVSYQPAVNIIYSSSSNTSPPPPSSPPPQGVPFSPAIPPNCPTNTQSCSSIGEPSWCCTTAQHCAFDDAGDVACCPIGDFCRGVVEYGAGTTSNGGGNGGSGGGSGAGSGGGGDSGSATGTGTGTGSDTQPDTWNLPGISNGNGGVTITSDAAATGRLHQYCSNPPVLVLLIEIGLGLWITGTGRGWLT